MRAKTGAAGTADRLAAPDDEAERRSPTPEQWAEIRVAIDRALDDRRISELRRRQRAAMRRHVAAVHRLRLATVPAIGCAAVLPFAVYAWAGGTDPGGASAASARDAAGPLLAAVCAGVLARMAARAGSVEGLAESVVYAYLGGVVGLAVTRGALGF